MDATLKQKLLKFGVEEKNIDNHASDLHVKYTPENYDFIMKNSKYNTPSFISTFISEVDGSKWIEIAFAYIDEHYQEYKKA